jgi:hypothetical protein
MLIDNNAALFDTANSFSGCIAIIHEVLRLHGFRENMLCIDKDELLSPG